MPWRQRRPSVPAMNTIWALRLGACAAITGAAASLTATVLEPDWGGDPETAVRVVADFGLWNTNHLVDLIGLLLTVAALTIAGHMLADAGSIWARVAQPFLLLMAALGASAVATGAAMKEMADTWAGAEGNTKTSYLAAFDALVSTTEVLFFAAFLGLGTYLAALGVAILAGRLFARWIGWGAALAAVLVICGDLLTIVSEPAFLGVLAGYALYKVVLVAIGVSMWRLVIASGPALDRATPGGRMKVAGS